MSAFVNSLANMSSNQFTFLVAALWIHQYGSEVAGLSSFNPFTRPLWTARHYNPSSHDLTSLMKLSLEPSLAGPGTFSAAVKAFREFLDNGLLNGPLEGDMLGPVFFPDTGLKATVHYPNGRTKEGQEVRNALWVDVLKMVGDDVLKKEGRALLKSDTIRARKPVIELELNYATNREDSWSDGSGDSDSGDSNAEDSYCGNTVIEDENADADVDEDEMDTITTVMPKQRVPSDISTSAASVSAILRSVIALLATELPAFVAHNACTFLVLKTHSSSFFNSLAHVI